jgi:uncharacterized membrane protein (UPF0127 family)
MFRLVLLALLLFVSVLDLARSALRAEEGAECARWRRAFQSMPARTLVIESSAGRRISIAVKLAGSDEARRAGFQCAPASEIQTGVLVLDFGREVLGGLSMANVPAAPDIAFVSQSGRIFSILRVEPSPTARYGPMGWYRYAIEARAGFFEEHGISPGDHAQLEKLR